ncbi:MAG TPA: SH3 domain-containing protein [Chloroflexota bacterium]|nr:SH3 domain-containing protein [Chloroflexota bacterium]
MRRIGQVRGSRSTGQVERLVVIGVGLLVVLASQTPPFAGLRAPASSAPARPAAVATAVGTPLATAAPLEAVAPAPAAEEPSPAAEPPRTALIDPPSYRVVAGGAGANLRGAPSTSAPVLQRVRDGTVVSNLDQQQTVDGQLWRRVADGSTEGWIAAELLEPAQ